jgi:peptidase E
MALQIQPIYLFADSQLLFWKKDGALFLDSIQELLTSDDPKAAYIGASNGDNPDYYSIFEAAMAGIGIDNCRMILSSFNEDDRSFIDRADIILLAGGDTEAGWKVFQEVGLNDVIIRRYYEGAVLIGVSAGAVQLGLYMLVERKESSNELVDTLKLVPYFISAHDEGEDWESLKATVQLLNGSVRGLAIPSGGGLVYYADQSIEAIRRPLSEFSLEGERLRRSLLVPEQV